MVDVMVNDLRRVVLGLLFVVAFGWMAALMFPGADQPQDGWQQIAACGPAAPRAL